MVLLSFCMERERSPAVFLSKELDTFLKNLGPDDKRVKWVGSMAVVLKENKFAGEPLKKSQIPRSYIEQYQVNNLFRYGHPEGYRSCYTIVNFCPHILDVMSHKEYDDLRVQNNVTSGFLRLILSKLQVWGCLHLCI